MKSVLIVFWIFLLVSSVQKTHTAIDDIMYEAEEEIKKSLPKFDYMYFSSPADYEDESVKEVSDDVINYNMDGQEEEFVKLQYDIILQKEQYNKLMGNDLALPPHRSRRNAIIDKDKLWPNGRIPYTIDNSFNETEKIIIEKAIGMWRGWTCLTFFEAVNNDFDKIYFNKITKGCGESRVGKVGGNQTINISYKCSTNVRVVTHEIGHAIGLYHEQMRNDRDNYITVHHNNIQNTNLARKNFEVMSPGEYKDFSKPYDYLSIMHYGKLFFSRDKIAELVTLTPKNKYYLDIIGEVQTISYLDAKIVSQLYNCAARCSSTCSGTNFMGAECQCMCRGPSDKNPIRLCPIRESCTMPTLDYSKYVVLSKDFISVSMKSGPFQNGTEFYIELKDVDACGYDRSTHRCDKGKWIGDLPTCRQLRSSSLLMQESGVDEFENCDSLDDYEDGKNITLICKSDISMMATLQCNNGSWTTFTLNCPKGDVCSMPKDAGTCGNWTMRWYFSTDSEKPGCQFFWYGGCNQGNGNNFADKDTCQVTCQEIRPVTTTQRPYYDCKRSRYGCCADRYTTQLDFEGSNCGDEDICSLPLVTPCDTPRAESSWYYDSLIGQCTEIPNKECNKNRNNFGSREECARYCSRERVCQPLIYSTETRCLVLIPRWTYSRDSGRCESFSYGGCGGSANNFYSEESCQQKCRPRVGPVTVAPVTLTNGEICGQPEDPGICLAYIRNWRYDTLTGVCVEFTYGGCGENKNNFDTRESCERFCSRAVVCQAFDEPEISCFAYIPRWRYDPQSRQCENFTYGGCQGNANNFETLETCESKCIPQTTAAPYMREICRLKADVGPCKQYIRKWQYNNISQSCEEFTYGGCLGNHNNFESKVQCMTYCDHTRFRPEKRTTTKELDIEIESSGEMPTSEPETGVAVCALGSRTGRCRAYVRSWFYNASAGQCDQFVYGGCDGNTNNFASQIECDQHCSPREVCLLPQQSGSCLAYIPRYYFDYGAQECREFVYGGCEKNANNFYTNEACLGRCGPLIRTEPPDTDSYYHLPMDALNDKKLVNPSGLDAKAIGAPEMVPGVKGQAIQIDGNIQKVRVSGPGHRMECFGDLSLCPDGYTIGLWLRVDTPGTGRGVYLSNGGDNIDSHGVAMSYKTGRLYWKFRMKNGREWRVMANNVLPRNWYHVMVTWKQTSGLIMYINGDKIAQAGTPSIRAPLTGNTAYNDFIIGQSNDGRGARDLGTITIDDFQFWSTKMTETILREKGPIYKYHITMDKFQDGRLIVPNLEPQTKGKLRQVPGKVGNAIEITGNEEYIDLGSFDDTCLGNTSLCMYGLTASFWIQFNQLRDNSYYMASGIGGFTFFSYGDRLYTNVQNGDRKWQTFASGMKTGVWYFVEVSWKRSTEIELFINNKKMASESTSTHQALDETRYDKFYIGKANTVMYIEKYGTAIIDDVQLYNADRQRLIDIDFIQRSDVCSMPKDADTCGDWTERWYFSTDSEKPGCQFFWYVGCNQGNGNNFADNDTCQATCHGIRPGDVCSMPKDAGTCGDWTVRWYFSTDSEKPGCQFFWYGGCNQGNGNNFADNDTCQATCHGIKPVTRPSPTSPSNTSATPESTNSVSTTPVSTINTPPTITSTSSTPPTTTSTSSTPHTTTSTSSTPPTTASTSSTSYTPESIGCTDGWMKHGKSCYFIGKDSHRTFSEAVSFCQGFNAKLIEVDSYSENQFVKNNLPEPKDRTSYWIGLIDIESDGTFMLYSSRKPASFFDWAYGEPNDENFLEDCVTFSGQYNFKWNDIPCNYNNFNWLSRLLPICEL